MVVKMTMTSLQIATSSRFTVSLLIAVGLAALIGCSSLQSISDTVTKPVVTLPATPPATPPPPNSPVPTTWVFCANEYQGCSFTGLRDVRFVLDGKATIQSFYGHLESCKEYLFGLSVGGSGAARCEYSSVMKTATLTNPMPGMGGLGATVTVPLGQPGFAEARVQATTDRGNLGMDVGAFREPCDVSHFAFDDPIVSPGKPGASHLHMFFGNSNTDAYSTTDSINNLGSSSCAGGILNRSAYWVPALIDGVGNVVLPSSAIFYYKSGYGGVKPADINAMPDGLRMISGDKNLSSAQGQGAWGCEEIYIGHLDSIKAVFDDGRCTAGNHLQLSFEFPQCWDGKYLDSSNHKSHMAFPTGSGCPVTHPKAIPVITFNVRFPIPAVAANNWHLSSDMYDYASKGGGFSAHGDWWNGWDVNTKNTWIKNCLNPSTDCHAYLLGDGRILF